jgi:hypothetical protein
MHVDMHKAKDFVHVRNETVARQGSPAISTNVHKAGRFHQLVFGLQGEHE